MSAVIRGATFSLNRGEQRDTSFNIPDRRGGTLCNGLCLRPPYIDQIQPEAVSMAVRRGQFEMNCPAATGQVLSRTSIPPVVQTIRFSGPVRDDRFEIMLP